MNRAKIRDYWMEAGFTAQECLDAWSEVIGCLTSA
jgi:hypothetical protein